MVITRACGVLQYDGETGMSPVRDKDVVEYTGWRGLRNNVPSVGFDLPDLEVALNIDVDDELIAHRRKGHSAVVIAGVDRDIYAEGAICMGVGSDALKLIAPNYGLITLHAGLTPLRPLSYAAVGDRVYYTNGAELGVVHNGARRAWGMTPPAIPAATATGGALRPGRYQYAMTYLRSDDQESGARLSGVIELTATGGIALTALAVSMDATVDRKVIYLSDVDAKQMWQYAVLANATTTFTITEPRTSSLLLATQFLTPPPAGDIIAYANGRMLVALGSRLYPSEPYAPELFDLRKGTPFTAPLTMVAPLEDGTWVGTQTEVAWLPNAEPEKWEFRKQSSDGVVVGTPVISDGVLIGDGGKKTPAVFFATTRGLCAGMAGGELVQFIEGRFDIPAQARGAGVVRKHRGIAQYMVTLQGTEIAANVAA